MEIVDGFTLTLLIVSHPPSSEILKLSHSMREQRIHDRLQHQSSASTTGTIVASTTLQSTDLSCLTHPLLNNALPF